jgi:protein TonB
MAYLDTQPLSRRLASLGTAGIIELAIGAALVAGLSVTMTPPKADPPQIPIDYTPAPPPPETPQPPAQPIDSVVTAPKPPIALDPAPQPLPIPTLDSLPYPVPTAGPTFEPRATPQPRPSVIPAVARPRNNPATWVTPLDYPARDLREGNQGTTYFRVVIGTNGRVQACEVTRSSGFASLDKAACNNISRRARFDAASDETGAKIVGTYASSVKWQIPR